MALYRLYQAQFGKASNVRNIFYILYNIHALIRVTVRTDQGNALTKLNAFHISYSPCFETLPIIAVVPIRN